MVLKEYVGHQTCHILMFLLEFIGLDELGADFVQWVMMLDEP